MRLYAQSPSRIPIEKATQSVVHAPASKQAQLLSHASLLRAARVMGPTLVALTFAGVAHAQGTMDFSGAQTLMGTFKTFAAFLRRAEEGMLSRIVVEAIILLAASRTNTAAMLRDAAAAYKVDTDAIALKVKQEFAAKEKAKKATEKTPARSIKKAAAA